MRISILVVELGEKAVTGRIGTLLAWDLGVPPHDVWVWGGHDVMEMRVGGLELGTVGMEVLSGMGDSSVPASYLRFTCGGCPWISN